MTRIRPHLAARPALLALIAALALAAGAFAADVNRFPGWERGSAYDKLYDAKKFESLKGELVRFIEVTPLTGMTPGLGLIMKDKAGKDVTVHLGPDKYLHFLTSGFAPGDAIKVKGAFAKISGLPVFMATKIRFREAFEVKFRTSKKGTPYWDMNDSELVEERFED